MPSRSAALQPQGSSGATEGHSSHIGAKEECPAGQRHATQSECWAAVSASHEEALATPAVKVVNTPLVPRGCSYSHASKKAIFNKHPAGTSGSLYELVCIAAGFALPPGHVLCERLCAGSSCYPVNNATTRVLDDGTVFAASRATRLAYDAAACPDCACTDPVWPIDDRLCRTTVVATRSSDPSRTIVPSLDGTYHDAPQDIAKFEAPPIGFGSRLNTMLTAAAYALKRGQGFQLSAGVCPIEHRDQPFCFFQPSSQCRGEDVRLVQAAEQDYHASLYPWRAHSRSQLFELHADICAKLAIPCGAQFGDGAAMLPMWRAVARLVYRVQPDVMGAIQRRWLAPLAWARNGSFAAMHVRRGDKEGELPPGETFRGACEYAAQLAGLQRRRGMAQLDATVFVASDELRAVLAELRPERCAVVAKHRWRVVSLRADTQLSRDFRESVVHRLWAEIALLVQAATVVVSETSNVGRLVQVLREADPLTLKYVEDTPSDVLWRP